MHPIPPHEPLRDRDLRLTARATAAAGTRRARRPRAATRPGRRALGLVLIHAGATLAQERPRLW